MPTKQWMEGRSLIVAWVTNKEKAAFLRACKKAGKGQSRAIREAIQAMLGLSDTAMPSGHHACASLEEARQKECEICLSRMP